MAPRNRTQPQGCERLRMEFTLGTGWGRSVGGWTGARGSASREGRRQAVWQHPKLQCGPERAQPHVRDPEPSCPVDKPAAPVSRCPCVLRCWGGAAVGMWPHGDGLQGSSWAVPSMVLGDPTLHSFGQGAQPSHPRCLSCEVGVGALTQGGCESLPVPSAPEAPCG